MLTFVLPRPPSTNNLFANVKGVGRIRSDVYRKWRRDAALLIRAENRAFKQVHGPFNVRITAGGARPRPDLDNIIKPIIDALVEAQVVEDDRHMVSVSASWSGSGRECVVEVSHAAADQSEAKERAA